jgi:GST-like protein
MEEAPARMIDLYTWRTPNGRKVSLMLEEIGLPYRVIAVDIGKGEQHAPAYVAINPNGKIPAIVDSDGPGGRALTVFESGAILLYLAEKTGQLLPAAAEERWQAIQWLQFQVSSLGPMLGQAQHFHHYATERVPYAEQRYVGEAQRLYGVLERRLSQSPYLAGEQYTIADVATWPWIRAWKVQGVDLNSYPNVARWLREIDERPAVIREREVLSDRKKSRPLDATARAVLFGQKT